MHEKKTQKERIFSHFKKGHEKWEYAAVDFMVPNTPHFVGYEAPTRLGDLCRDGLITKARIVGRFAFYRITRKGLETDVVPASRHYTRGVS